MTDKRIYAFDLMKSVAMFLVCFYHFGTLDYSYETILSGEPASIGKYFISALPTISVPLFLMVNGALLFNRGFNLRKHMYKIFCVYLLFFVWAAITLVLDAPKFGDHYSPVTFLSAIFSTEQGRLDHLWFLQVLAYLYFMFPLLKAAYDKNEPKLTIYVVGIIFFFTFGIVLLQNIVSAFNYLWGTHPVKINIASSLAWLSPFGNYFPHALLYFLLGGLLVKYINKINIGPLTAAFFLMLGWVALFAFALWKTSATKQLYDVSFEGYKLIMPLIMTVSVFILCLKINITNKKLQKVISVVGANTLGLYFIHIPVGVWLTDFYVKLDASKYFVCDVLYVLFLIALSLGITLVIKRTPLLRRLIMVKSGKNRPVLQYDSPVVTRVTVLNRKESVSV